MYKLKLISIFLYHEKVFWARFVKEKKAQYIKHPTNPAEAADNLEVYRRLGFPGAVGSTDCTHVYWGRCPAQLMNVYTGKEKSPTISYQVTVNHSRYIMHVTSGHPGARNDKTIAKMDTFVQQMHSKQILHDVEFNLFKADGTTHTVRGAYLITDNGYARWRIMQCPTKSGFSILEMLWSARLESVRKDVECTFGILKGRFRILSGTVLFKLQSNVDNVFVACCILHNMNLIEDERHVAWKNPENWEVAEEGDDDDLREGRELRRLRGRYLHKENHVAISEVPIVNIENDEEADDNYYDFRAALIEHFIYCRSNGGNDWI
jgi:hypothetical protein